MAALPPLEAVLGVDCGGAAADLRGDLLLFVGPVLGQGEVLQQQAAPGGEGLEAEIPLPDQVFPGLGPGFQRHAAAVAHLGAQALQAEGDGPHHGLEGRILGVVMEFDPAIAQGEVADIQDPGRSLGLGGRFRLALLLHQVLEVEAPLGIQRGPEGEALHVDGGEGHRVPQQAPDVVVHVEVPEGDPVAAPAFRHAQSRDRDPEGEGIEPQLPHGDGAFQGLGGLPLEAGPDQGGDQGEARQEPQPVDADQYDDQAPPTAEEGREKGWSGHGESLDPYFVCDSSHNSVHLPSPGGLSSLGRGWARTATTERVGPPLDRKA